MSFSINVEGNVVTVTFRRKCYRKEFTDEMLRILGIKFAYISTIILVFIVYFESWVYDECYYDFH